MRVLHLIDAASSQACPTTLALVSDSVDRLGNIDQRVLLLGGSPLRGMARSVGLRYGECRGVPFGMAIHAWATMPRLLREWGRFDVVHCWSIGAATLASLAMPRTPRLLTLTVQPPRQHVHWLRMLTGVGAALAPMVVLPISHTIRRELLAGGLAEVDVHVLRPGIDRGRIATHARTVLRKRWGVEDQTSKVIALLSDPPQAGDAIDAVWAIGLMNLSVGEDGLPVRLLVTPRQHRRIRAEQLSRATDRLNAIIVCSQLDRPWEVLPGCDAAFVLGASAGGLSLIWAMAAGVPIIGEARYAVSEIVEDRHSALLTKPDAPVALAHRLGQLFTDDHLAWQLRDTACHEAYSFFSRVRYCQSLRRVYEQIADGLPVEVPPLEVTGGIRFAGRA